MTDTDCCCLNRFSENFTKAFHAVCIVSMFCLLIGLSSCSGERFDYDKLPTQAVRGTVTFQGKPAAGVNLYFHPSDSSHKEKYFGNGIPRATVDADGNFAVTTYKSKDGIPAGEYTVTAKWQERLSPEDPTMSPDKLGQRYDTIDKSDIKVTIKEGDTNIPAIELK